MLAHGPADDLPGRIDAAERFYAGHAATPRFQICDDCPAGLDDALAGRGYRLETPVALLTSEQPAAMNPPIGMTVRTDPAPAAAWTAVAGAEPPRPIELPQTFVTVFRYGEPVGAGRAVADDGWTGVFDMATAPAARRQGAARLTLAAITRWAGLHHAPRLYLQVEQSNEAATRLYETAGFRHLTTYHYRVA